MSTRFGYDTIASPIKRPWVNHPTLIDVSKRYDEVDIPRRYWVRMARHTCGKIAGVPTSMPVIPTTDGATTLNTTQNSTVTPNTVTGIQRGNARLRTNMTIKAMIAISIFAFEINIGVLSVLIA